MALEPGAGIRRMGMAGLPSTVSVEGTGIRTADGGRQPRPKGTTTGVRRPFPRAPALRADSKPPLTRGSEKDRHNYDAVQTPHVAPRMDQAHASPSAPSSSAWGLAAHRRVVARSAATTAG